MPGKRRADWPSGNSYRNKKGRTGVASSAGQPISNLEWEARGGGGGEEESKRTGGSLLLATWVGESVGFIATIFRAPSAGKAAAAADQGLDGFHGWHLLL